MPLVRPLAHDYWGRARTGGTALIDLLATGEAKPRRTSGGKAGKKVLLRHQSHDREYCASRSHLPRAETNQAGDLCLGWVRRSNHLLCFETPRGHIREQLLVNLLVELRRATQDPEIIAIGSPDHRILVVWSKIKDRSEEHTSELQSRLHLVCRLLLEKKKKKKT